uniref:Hypoxia-inducible factor 1 alpha subunit n=1 Tax=Sinonovacula constricta TaxID=98310 RepID=A0AA96J1U2_SINCO|nr:hypoxia-inducible factor 1 alpha subunit [Sinonovacula constricta]
MANSDICNSEKRKEKSRDAARCRRGKEAEIFNDLANQLPLCPTVIEQLDKASVMRLLLSALKVYSVLGKRDIQDEPVEEGSLEEKMNSLYPKALGGFLVVLSKDGDFIYVSETISRYLGIQQIDLMGQSIYEFSHPCDHDEIQDLLSGQSRSEEDDDGGRRTVLVRLKCTLTSKGRSVNLKSATYKVIQLSGKFIADDDTVAPAAVNMCVDDEDSRELEMMEADDGEELMEKPCRTRALPHLIAIGEPIPHPSNIEVPLDKRTFLSRHSLNMRFTDCDDRIKHLIGYQADEMLGTSLYGFHHAMDSKMMEKAFRDLFSKGQTCTEQYRFLAKNGGYVWVVTQATVIFNSRTQKPQCVVCVHYVLSHVEQHGRVLSSVQAPVVVKSEEPVPLMLLKVEKSSSPQNSPVASRVVTPVPLPKQTEAQDMRVAELLHVPVPIFSTEDVFDTTEDMEDLYNHTRQESFGTSLSLYDDLEFKNGMAQSNKSKKEVRMKDCKQMDLDSSPPMTPMLSTINTRDGKAKDCLLNNYNSDAEIDFEHRAPFITMNPDEDYMLKQPSEDIFLNMGIDFNPGVFNCTETVFNLKDELYEGPPPERRSQTPQEMLGGSTVKASIDQPQDKMMMRLKRPLNRSCLEKGPPLKMPKYQATVRDNVTVSPPVSDNCYLKALLLMKDGHRTGNSAGNKQNISNMKDGTASYLRSLLTTLSAHDLERSMPIRNESLLEGADIQRALDGLIK